VYGCYPGPGEFGGPVKLFGGFGQLGADPGQCLVGQIYGYLLHH
jgi:hypothetical protein